jgi:aryl-alcohol dehydrogenase-like predicted oxidoreductase
MFKGFATTQGTARFASRFEPESAAGFYRHAQDLSVSSLGIGTYLGQMNETTDEGYRQAITRGLNAGINFIDTSLNYRHERSERAISRALASWVHDAGGSRDEIVLSTKAGFLVPNAVPAGMLNPGEVVAGIHCLAPAFLRDQIKRSRANLGVETLDIFYLHNPETQLSHVSEEVFYSRIRAAFELLEHLSATGDIRWYGAATWDGFRRGGEPPSLSLVRLNDIARAAGGDSHHFRFIQLPLNLAMPEALSKPLEQGRTVLDLAQSFGLTVVCSASLLQARLSRGLPAEIAAALPGARTDAQRAIQFTRSAPGVTVALVGMSNPAHVDENLGVARLRPLPAGDFARVLS